MRLLLFGHHSDTGFGVVTQKLAERFLAAGHDVRVIAVNHRGEPVQGPLAGRVWPAELRGQAYGGNISSAAIAGTLWRQYDRTDTWKPDRVLVIADMSGLFGHLDPRGITEEWRSVPVFHYCPIEGDNLSLGWREVWKEFTPVAMSDYGARVIAEHIGRPVERIYHGVESEVFRPVAAHDPLVWDGKPYRTKEECKRAFGIDPSKLVVLRADRNVERKFYDRFLTVADAVAERMPNVEIVVHCSLLDSGRSMYEDIARHPGLLGRLRATQAHDTWKGLPAEGLNVLYNAADVYVTTTGGEGFGLTLAESMAAEVPVVSTGWAAETEVVGPGGVIVPPLTDSYGETVRYHSTYGMDWAVPDSRAFVEPIIDLLTHPARRRALGKAGRRHVIANFNWDTAAAQFLALFEESDAARLAA